MKKYLRELPNKSHTHRKRFALLASGGFTLAIFALWSVVTFGREPVVKDTTGPVNLAAVAEVDITPFHNIIDGISDSLRALTGILGNEQ